MQQPNQRIISLAFSQLGRLTARFNAPHIQNVRRRTNERVLSAIAIFLLALCAKATTDCEPIARKNLPDGSSLSFHSCAAPKRVFLDEPRSLQQFRRTQPALYKRLDEIVKGIGKVPSNQIPRWLKATHGIEHASTGQLWHTSYPPKLRVNFELEGIHFTGIFNILNFPVNLSNNGM